MTWIFDARRKPIHLPDASPLTRAEAELIHRLGYTLTQWRNLTDAERSDHRWRAGA